MKNSGEIMEDQHVCGKCGNPIKADSAFCPFCGAAVNKEKKEDKRFCKRCGKAIKADALFCPYCGLDRTAAVPVLKEEEPPLPVVPEKTKKVKKKSVIGRIFGFILKVLLAVILIIALLLGLSYFLPEKANRIVGDYFPVDLPFDYQLDIPWLAEIRGNNNSSYPQAQESAVPVAPVYDSSEHDSTTESDNMFENALIHYIGDRKLESSDYSQITSVSIDGSMISLNSGPIASAASKNGSIDLEQLSIFPNLKEVYAANTEVVFPRASKNPGSVVSLYIDNCTVGEAAAGIENMMGLQKVHISNTDLADLSNIAKLPALTELDAPNNQIADTYAVENCRYLTKAVLYGNHIWDYRGLRNVKTVDIWNNNGSDRNIGSAVKYRDAYQVQVTVSKLRVRTSPDADSKTNILDDRAVEGYYYYILDEYWDPKINAVWYKIGNDMWIAGGNNGKEYTKVMN